MGKGLHNKQVRGQKNYRWNNGRLIASTGYVLVRVPDGHPFRHVNGYAFEHLVVLCEVLGADALKGKIVHHINGDKTDNRVENLRAMTRGEHNAEHLMTRGRCGTSGRLLPRRKVDA